MGVGMIFVKEKGRMGAEVANIKTGRNDVGTTIIKRGIRESD
ncbi:hypothetical protein TIFTF001_020713 [Ficus carica]|uniref:Uncharacterized protein n=1 Tax=Ficus carica TaxID=3494 RepID=A0AA88AEB1_FICCA|nr:hypothetical protein TIFTF001_020713 [Ficus carica]